MTIVELATMDVTELDPTIFGGPVVQDQGNFPVVVSYAETYEKKDAVLYMAARVVEDETRLWDDH